MRAMLTEVSPNLLLDAANGKRRFMNYGGLGSKAVRLAVIEKSCYFS